MSSVLIYLHDLILVSNPLNFFSEQPDAQDDETEQDETRGNKKNKKQEQEEQEEQDVCLAHGGKPNRDRKPTVCCNKKCPKCGGQGCGKQKDASGKKLKISDCCVGKILEKGKTCRSGRKNAPCKLP